MTQTHSTRTAHSSNNATTSTWFDALVTETATIDSSGVHAAMVSIRLHPCENPSRAASQARTLFGLILRPTDRLQQTTPVAFSVLLAPLRDLPETVNRVQLIDEALSKAQLDASTGYAQRRAGESLIDTWARAEAQLDRAVYRIEHADGLRVA